MSKGRESINSLGEELLPEPLNKSIEQVAIEERQETEDTKSDNVQAGDKRREGFSLRSRRGKNKTPPTETQEKPPTTVGEAIESIKAEGWETKGEVRARDGTLVLE